MVKSFIGLLAVLLLHCGVFAKTPKLIDFAKKGSSSLVREERGAANNNKSFAFCAKKVQKPSLSFINDAVEGSMD